MLAGISVLCVDSAFVLQPTRVRNSMASIDSLHSKFYCTYFVCITCYFVCSPQTLVFCRNRFSSFQVPHQSKDQSQANPRLVVSPLRVLVKLTAPGRGSAFQIDAETDRAVFLFTSGLFQADLLL